ncbi:MAG: alpha-L-fucosidase [Clostridia bacterium]|nr:alpha-L-fucosidase [Clostridia bacterium]
MIIKDYVKEFERLGLGMFVHFGLYSVLGRGEWVKFTEQIPDGRYDSLMLRFDPAPDWAEKLCAAAAAAGCGYVTLTARHHDGFSLYDTRGLCGYDAPHSACGRDLVKEFTEAAARHGLKPFFYHTLLDWHQKSYREDFPKYLEYLRESVKLLCTRYGRIGGIWFDGMWDRPEDDWQEDALYGLIREYQPNAMIINNTGLDARGALGHAELDSVTFERGAPVPLNLKGSPKYVASEMCETMNDCWGYGAADLNYKSGAKILEEMVLCRRYGANFLLNTGPLPDGSLRTIDRGIFENIGIWMSVFGEPFRNGRPTSKARIIEKSGDSGGKKDFILEGENGRLYAFCFGLPTVADPHVTEKRSADRDLLLVLSGSLTVKSVRAMDTGDVLDFEEKDGAAVIHGIPFGFGRNLVVRVLEIETCEK